jgi:hypothetical protein
LSPPTSSPPEELIRMVKTLADIKADMPRKHRGILGKEYGLNVDVTKVMDALHYTAGAGKLMPDLRFSLKAHGVSIRSYKPGDWETTVKRAYDDLLANSGAFKGLSIKLREPTGATAEVARRSRKAQPRKKRGIFDRIMGVFTDSER